MNLESPKSSVDHSAQYLFDSLSDVKNFEKLMPESIAKFEVLGDDAFFNVVRHHVNSDVSLGVVQD